MRDGYEDDPDWGGRRGRAEFPPPRWVLNAVLIAVVMVVGVVFAIVRGCR